MARDYLAIQGSATPSERAFSSGGITGTARRSCLTVEMFEALQILKSAYRGGHIIAANDAEMQVTDNIGDWETLVAMEDCTDNGDEDAV
jgi:hAT family C-terminal dimerisation region